MYKGLDGAKSDHFFRFFLKHRYLWWVKAAETMVTREDVWLYWPT